MNETKCTSDLCEEGIDLEESYCGLNHHPTFELKISTGCQTLNEPQQGEFWAQKLLWCAGNDAKSYRRRDGESFRPSTKILIARRQELPSH